MAKLIINGIMNDEEIRWKKIKCCCSHIEGDVEHQFPIGECKHCKCQYQEDSMPRESFNVNNDEIDKDGNVTKKQTREVKEINIVRGEKYQDIIGWSY
tara:strand:- start:393 stop:686 length:294 start_codon:yes stop_codon:yes gene_type:complete